MQDTFARATHSALRLNKAGRPSAARDDRVSCIQGRGELKAESCVNISFYLSGVVLIKNEESQKGWKVLLLSRGFQLRPKGTRRVGRGRLLPTP